MSRLKLTGLVAAPHTPMAADGSLLLRSIEQQVQILTEGRISAAFVCGTTGEGLSLSSAERMQVAERWVRAAPASLPIVVQVGHSSAVEARALAAHAQSIGAAAVAAMAPFFFKPRGVPELVEFCAVVAGGAPKLPFYFYHLPSMTGVSLSMLDLLQQARQRIPTFAGIKYTHNDVMEFQQLLHVAGDDLDVLFGRDEMLLAGLAVGARGAIGSTYNYAAPVYQRMMDAFAKGDLATARGCQAHAARLVEHLRRYGEIPAAKAIMGMQGVECGPARSPLANLSTDEVKSLARDLADLDVFTRPLRTSPR